MEYPRRSARLSPHVNNNQPRSQTSAPAFGRSSQTSSTTTTSYPSPTNDSESDQNPTSQPPQEPRYSNLNFQSSMAQNHLNAPLPSPSANDIDPVFARPHSQPNPYQNAHLQHQNQQQPASSHPPENQHEHAPHHNSFSQHKHNNINPAGVLPADFLAEAAKRAQMACLMRDLGDVSL
jgi:hypothetical protein